MNTRDLYIDLLKRAVLNTIYKDDNIGPFACKYSEEFRTNGQSCPGVAHTMIGRLRLDNIHFTLASVIGNNVPGDFIETGVWRGGASIFARGLLKAYDENRTVWVADSFEGLPAPSPGEYPADAGAGFHNEPILRVSLETVQENFKSYGLLDDKVKFLKGWFKDTLPSAPIERLAVLRLDGDMYESTIQSLNALYDKVSFGGFTIIDDYWLPACKQAVDDFRNARQITSPLVPIDWTGVYWKK